MHHTHVHRKSSSRKRPSTLPLFIGGVTNIDDILGEPAAYNTSVISRVYKQEARVGGGEFVVNVVERI